MLMLKKSRLTMAPIYDISNKRMEFKGAVRLILQLENGATGMAQHRGVAFIMEALPNICIEDSLAGGTLMRAREGGA
ncbi:unnamed protein product, partial [Cylicostephanus goldi]